MEEHRHNAQVERRLKEAMRFDRARIQLGRISPFGLLELSRQRLRPSLFEASTEVCRFCRGTGRIRSTESTSLHVLRAIEEEGSRRRGPGISVAVPTSVALYILNQKRRKLSEIESRHGFRVYLSADDSLIAPDFRIDRLRALAPGDEPPPPALPPPVSAPEEPEPEEAELEAEAEGETEEERIEASTDRDMPQLDYGMPRMADEAEDEEDRAGRPRGEDGRQDRGERADHGDRGGRRRRRRRRRGGGQGAYAGDGHRGREERGRPMAGGGQAPAAELGQPRHEPEQDYRQPQPEPRQTAGELATPAGEPGAGHPAAEGGDQPRRRRRRGRRGGRRRSRRDGQPHDGMQPREPAQGWSPEAGVPAGGEPRYPFATPANPWGVTTDDGGDEEPEAADEDSRGNRIEETAVRSEQPEADERDAQPEEPQPAPPEPEREPVATTATARAPEPAERPSEPTAEPAPRRRGWWRRRE
jgi:ribonuclease E